MKQLLSMVCILTLFSGCSQKTVEVIHPTAHTIDAKTKPMPTRTFSYEKVKANSTMTFKVDSAVLPWRDATWYRAKMNRCERNNRKLLVANTALNMQIRVLNHE